MDINNAYRVLGVKEGAQKQEIEKRYSILLKRQRQNRENVSTGQNDTDDFDQITAAYNLLMGYNCDEFKEDSSYKNGFLYKRLGIDYKKVSNFFYYHKAHIAISIVVIIALFVFISPFVNRVESDLDIALIGDLAYSNDNTFKQNIRSAIPGLKEPSVVNAQITQVDKGLEYMQAAAIVTAGGIDVYIVDKVNFSVLAEQGIFASLDDLVEDLGIDKEKNKAYLLNIEQNNKEPQLYGIDVSESAILKEPVVYGKQKIATLSSRPKNRENAVKLLKALLRK
ncbi:MAG: hypothetical protein N3B21_16905 [Clostridia bacterium]|nr:hypothetical protein [Clostridia bacterium]